jgi:hypothetical protein
MPTIEEYYKQFVDPGTPTNKIVGPALASAASVQLTHAIHEVTGTVAIATLLPPYTGFQGKVTLIWTNANPGGVTTGGNIAAAKDPAQDTALTLVFNGTTWYPEFPLS